MKETKGIKLICRDLYCDCPKWLPDSEGTEYLILDKNTPAASVDLFLRAIFAMNDIDFGLDAAEGFQNLIADYKENGLIMSGGVLFYESDKEIYPGCCCGLEDWYEVYGELELRESPWLGHDPFPVFEYRGEHVIVWEDDCIGKYAAKKTKQGLTCIEYKIEDLKRELVSKKKELQEFCAISFFQRVSELESTMADELTETILTWLLPKKKKPRK